MSVDPQSRALTLQLYNLHITPMIIEIETKIFSTARYLLKKIDGLNKTTNLFGNLPLFGKGFFFMYMDGRMRLTMLVSDSARF